MLTRNGLQISKRDLSNEQMSFLYNELEVEPFQMGMGVYNVDDRSSFKVYKETEEYITIPRFYPNIPKVTPFNFDTYNAIPESKHYRSNETNCTLEFNGSIRKEQEPPINALLKACSNVGGGIVSVPCGFGKTVMAIYVACKLKQKTLVIVHQEHLLHQWCERIEQFTNASMDNGKIGFIRRDKVKVDDCDIVIGMLQSIAMRDYPMEIFQEFNTVIVDECHHVAAEVFSRALPKIVAPYTIGLSATPRRKDGLTKVFKWFLGDIVYFCVRDLDDSIQVQVANFKSTDAKYNRSRTVRIRGKTQPNFSGMVNQITEHKPRTKFIVETLKPYIMDGRYCLILTERKKHMKDLYCYLQPILKERSMTAGYYCGGMKKKELEMSLKCDVIIATFQMAAEAFDCAKLNTLVLASSKTDIEQSVGRILRKKHAGMNPIIIDIVDEQHNIFKNQAIKRQRYYKRCGYKIFNNDNVTIDDSMKLSIKTSAKTSTKCLI